MRISKKYNSVIFSFILLLATSISLQAQITVAESENSLLWEISGNELTQPSYLFGTIHLIPEKDYFFTKTMQEKFESCKTLALEADIDISLSEQVALVKKIILPAGKTLKDYMTEKQFNKYRSYMIDSLGIKSKKFKKIIKLKPFFSIAIILNELLEKPVVYEKKLSKAAKKQKMKVIGLETLDYQLSVIEKISIEEQVEIIFNDSLVSNPIDEYKILLEAYKGQDLIKINELVKAETDIKDFEQEFLITRNKNWIHIIENLIEEQSTFIAVGAAHLPGENGIIKLLRDKGYTVQAQK